MLGRTIHFINSFPLSFFVRGKDLKTILDVGCGVNSPVNYFVSQNQVLDGLDIFSAEIDKQARIKYRQIINCDVRDFTESNKYDLVTALDFIEHFTKDDGSKVLSKLESISSRRVVIITPNGFVPQPGTADNPFQEHKSGWSVDDLTKRGYRVYGMFGPKFLRGEFATLKYRPKILFGLVSLLLYPFYFWLPKKSFSLLAVYDKKYDR